MSLTTATDEDGFPVGASEFYWDDPLGRTDSSAGEARRAVRKGWSFSVTASGVVVIDDLTGGPGIAGSRPTACELADEYVYDPDEDEA